MQVLSDFESNNLFDVCLLKKTIYCLKQSVKMWYNTLKTFLTGMDLSKFDLITLFSYMKMV